jgi:hypothetical protein
MTFDREREFRTVLPSPQQFFVLVRSLVDHAQMIAFFVHVFEPLNQNVSHIAWNAPGAQPSLD